jgi:dTDP-glucose pyrophosphorylase
MNRSLKVFKRASACNSYSVFTRLKYCGASNSSEVVYMNVVILSAGQSSRLGFKEKCALKVVGNPLISYSFGNALSISPKIVRIVVKPDSSIPSIITHRKSEFVVQPRPLGTMNALEIAVDTFPFLLMLGDEILLGQKIDKMVSFYNNSSADGVIGYVLSSPIEVKKTYEVELSGSIVKRVTEKPKSPKTNCKGTGNCIINERLWNEMRESEEKNFVEAINYSLAKRLVMGFEVCEEYFNINTEEDLRLAEDRLKTVLMKQQDPVRTG